MDRSLISALALVLVAFSVPASGEAHPSETDMSWKNTPAAEGVPVAQDGGRILAVKTLCKQPGRFIGWPSIAQAPNGDLLAVFSGNRTAHISPDGKVQMVRSTDAGETWGKPVRTEVTTPPGPVQLSDGRILFVGQRPHESHSETYDVGIQESLDDGRSWQTIGTFPVPEGVKMLSYGECHVAECADKRLIILFRDCFEPHRIRQSESMDGGRTWPAPHVTEMLGYPPHVIRLRDNRLLTVYAKRWEPFGQYACSSSDNGKTWDVAQEVRLSSAWANDIGYPASVQLDDGGIWTVYYQPGRPGEKPCLMGTHWTPALE